jgi:uncharacterized membrane protein YhiD involved in acid resistance
MLNSIFSGVFDTNTINSISIQNFLLCIGCALVLGFLLSLAYMWKSRYSKSFVVTLALLPSIVCVVIMMVNGNVGTGVAVAGAFSLVRFRSIPGSAREISALFVAMGAGLIAGMGYLGFAFLFTLVLCAMYLIYTVLNFGNNKKNELNKTLRITIPEDLNYTEVFDDIFDELTTKKELVQVKTTNMGSLFKLTYNLTLKKAATEKELLDKLRCHNGNLEIAISRQEDPALEL